METFKLLVTRTRVEGLAIMLVAAAYLWETSNVPEFYQLPDAPGPTTFPYLLGTVFALVGLWLLISPKELMARLRADAAEAPFAAPAAASTAPRESVIGRLAADWHFYSMWVIVLGYLWLMPVLGFPIATFLLLAPFIFLLGERRWHVALVYAFVVTIAIFGSFKFGLNVRLPLGVLDLLVK